MTVMLLSCMFGAFPGMTRYTNRFDPALCAISHIATSAWGIHIWVHIKDCESDAVVVLFGRSVPVTNRSFQIFAIFFFTYIGMTAIIEGFPSLLLHSTDSRNLYHLAANIFVELMG